MPKKYQRGSAFSISVIGTFHQCPLKGWLGIIQNIQPQRAMPDADRGSAIHRLMAWHLSDLNKPWKQKKAAFLAAYPGYDIDEAIDILDGIEAIYGPDVCVLPEDTKPADYFVELELTFRRDGSPILRRGKKSPPAFGATIDVLQLSPDRRLAVITDYKTNRRPPYQEIIEQDPQMRAYAWAVLQHFPQLEEIGLKKSYLRHEWSKRVPIIYFAREEFENVWNELAGKAMPIIRAQQAVRDGMDPMEAFPPNPNQFCGWCSVRDHCPAFSKALILPDKTNVILPEDIAHWAVIHRLASARIKELEAALKHHVQEVGDIRVGNHQVYGYKPSSKNDLDQFAIIDALKEFGWTPRQIIETFFKPSKGALESLAKKHNEDTEEDKARKQQLRNALKGATTKIPGVGIGWRKLS